MVCSRCSSQLLFQEMGESGFYTCPNCVSILIPQRLVIPILAMVAEELGAVSEHCEVPQQEDLPGDVVCPQCDSLMTRFGYQGTNRVILDRCNDCMLVWMDPGEVRTAAFLYLRTSKRSQNVYSTYRENLARWVRQVALYRPVRGPM